MNTKKNIIVTGFMASGKSTAGRIVAQRLSRQFVDMDDVIESRAGKSIPRIFADEGEAAFRAMERELAEELAAQSKLVIATGGGTLVRRELRELMGGNGAVICLRACRDDIRKRLERSDGRPLAGNWETLLESRRADYAQIEHQVDTSGKTPEAVAAEIIALCFQRLHVKTPAGSGYDIWIQPGILKEIDKFLDEFGFNEHVVVVTNDSVAPIYADPFVARLPMADLIVVPDGEAHKNLATVARIYDGMLACGADRNSTLVALGGGVVGDMAGYAAATYMRGINLVQVPSTLLSMVDSSVGGKVGVDLPQGKNLIGAFKQPGAVIIDTEVINTLPPLQWRCGMAEVIKHGLIGRPSLLEPAIWEKDCIVDLVREAVQVKIDVVEQDPYERGIRAHLNLGHTFGHAIEKVTRYEVPHGEAVSIGIAKAAELSHRLGMIDRSLAQRIESIFRRIGLPVDIDIDPDEWYEAMATDKKWQAGKPRLVLLRGLGEATVIEGLSRDEIQAVM